MAQCKGVTQSGDRCRKPGGDNGYCSTPAHQAQATDPVPDMRTPASNAGPQQVRCVSCDTMQTAKPGNHKCTNCPCIFKVRA